MATDVYSGYLDLILVAQLYYRWTSASCPNPSFQNVQQGVAFGTYRAFIEYKLASSLYSSETFTKICRHRDFSENGHSPACQTWSTIANKIPFFPHPDVVGSAQEPCLLLPNYPLQPSGLRQNVRLGCEPL
jgi:hypothetical protein